MRSIIRIAAMTGVAVLALSALPASPAAATVMVQDGSIPADCDVERLDTFTASMTCTDRPADQTWQHITVCGFGWASEVGHGEVVTGNGISTAQCSQFTYRGSVFYQPL